MTRLKKANRKLAPKHKDVRKVEKDINTCLSCPHCKVRNFEEGLGYVCLKSDSRKLVSGDDFDDYAFVIPDWCPLPK